MDRDPETHPEYGDARWTLPRQTQDGTGEREASGAWTLSRRQRGGGRGQHAVLGGVVGLLFPLATYYRDIAFPAISLASVFTVLFLAYEITEGWRIRDWAYRDIGGYMTGLLISGFVGILVSIALSGVVD